MRLPFLLCVTCKTSITSFCFYLTLGIHRDYVLILNIIYLGGEITYRRNRWQPQVPALRIHTGCSVTHPEAKESSGVQDPRSSPHSITSSPVIMLKWTWSVLQAWVGWISHYSSMHSVTESVRFYVCQVCCT